MLKFNPIAGTLDYYEASSATGIADPGSNGILARTALNTTSARTITGTSNQVTVTNGDGVSGNPTLSLPQDIHTGASPTFGGQTLTGDGSQTSSATAQWSFRGFKQYFTTSSFANAAGVQYGVQASATDATNADFVFDKVNYQGNWVSNLLKIASSGNVTYYGNQAPNADSTYTNGTSSRYWSNTYTDRLYLNSTAYLDGGTAGKVLITGMPELTTTGEGIVMKSPDGTRYKVTVANGGTLSVTAA